MNGENYVESRDIRAQLNKLDNLNVKLPFKEDIRKLASTINSWEAESRYNDDFTALLEDIDDANKLANEMITYCDGLIQQRN